MFTKGQSSCYSSTQLLKETDFPDQLVLRSNVSLSIGKENIGIATFAVASSDSVFNSQ